MGRPKGSKNKVRSDLTGQTFGHYEVLYETEKTAAGTRSWMCRCKCGKENIVYQSNLVRRPDQMCTECRNTSRRVSQMHKSMRNVYEGMLGRCYSESDPVRYAYYGGRGIKVCDRWLEPDGQGFKNFWEDMGDRPEGSSLDRIDVNGDYCPDNCRWVGRGIQAYNRRMSTRNTSGRTGVSWNEEMLKWEVHIGFEGKSCKIGYFADFEEACKEREKAEVEYYGQIKE